MLTLDEVDAYSAQARRFAASYARDLFGLESAIDNFGCVTITDLPQGGTHLVPLQSLAWIASIKAADGQEATITVALNPTTKGMYVFSGTDPSLRSKKVQLVPLGRPNRNDDGEPKLLAEALAESPVETAYTRCEPDENHAYPRVIAVNREPSYQWRVIEWKLQGGWSGMKPHFPHPSDVQHAEAYTADTLNIPRAAVWWPAVGGLSIQYLGDDYSTALAVE